MIRVQITIDEEVYPELAADLQRHKGRARAERLRVLALLGLASISTGPASVNIRPVPQEPAKPKPHSPVAGALHGLRKSLG